MSSGRFPALPPNERITTIRCSLCARVILRAKRIWPAKVAKRKAAHRCLRPHQEKLFEVELAWAEQIATRMARSLPPSFDIEDLRFAASKGLIKAAQRFKPGTKEAGWAQAVPFRGFARRYVRGEVLMSVRRRNYTEAMHEELEDSAIEPTGDKAVQRGQMFGELGRAVAMLGGLEGEVVRYLYQHEFEPDYVAAVLGVTAREVEEIRARAVESLRGRLVRR